MTYRLDNGGLQLETADFGGGVIRPTINGGQEIYYFLRDHLGSVRAIVDESGEAIERNDYYPFGSHRTVAGSGATANRFKYNGKEVQTTGELGFLDYGARMYDAGLGRWFNTDPLAEKYYSESSYNYCGNNPVVFVDPNGNEVIRNNAGDITITGDDLIGYWGNLKLVLEGKTPYENFLESIEKAADSDRHRFLNLSQDIDVIEQYIPQEGYRWKENFPLVYYTANNDLLVVSKATNKYVSILNKQLEYDFEVQYKKQNNIKTKYWSPVSDIRLLSALLSGYASAVNPNPLSLLPPNSFMRDIGDGWQVADRMLKQKRFQYYKKFDIIY